ncbi:hypothetical protein NECAME_00123 [Necator americanus]|uniref:Uncharacterized protein n=1 Tax=Necator americanus TaxID=51031 RepID=W2U020_NECAM|nr:hypothetical protein NECAME_00123 [Necator americanus]ETN87264.1 hypothetical protein NECAME_00123 [Necator americanus]
MYLNHCKGNEFYREKKKINRDVDNSHNSSHLCAYIKQDVETTKYFVEWVRSDEWNVVNREQVK